MDLSPSSQLADAVRPLAHSVAASLVLFATILSILHCWRDRAHTHCGIIERLRDTAAVVR